MKNNQNPYEFIGKNSSNLINFKKYVPIFEKYGVVIFRGFFNNDLIFEKYYEDLKNLTKIIIKKKKLKINNRLDLNELITQLSKNNRKEVGYIYDLGTRPMKLLRRINLKNHPKIISLINVFFKNKSILANPHLGETLHIFPPGKENYKYNLPMHRDYPYLMQF